MPFIVPSVSHDVAPAFVDALDICPVEPLPIVQPMASIGTVLDGGHAAASDGKAVMNRLVRDEVTAVLTDKVTDMDAVVHILCALIFASGDRLCFEVGRIEWCIMHFAMDYTFSLFRWYKLTKRDIAAVLLAVETLVNDGGFADRCTPTTAETRAALSRHFRLTMMVAISKVKGANNFKLMRAFRVSGIRSDTLRHILRNPMIKKIFTTRN